MRKLLFLLLFISFGAVAQPSARFHAALHTISAPPPSSSFQTETINYMAAVIANGGTWDSTMYKDIDTLVRDIKGFTNPRYATSNYLSKITQLLPFVGGIAATHKFNLLDTSTFQATFVGSPTHSASGIALNGSTQYINTNYNCSLQTYSNMLGAIYYDNTSTSSGYVFGYYDGGVGVIGFRSEPSSLNTLTVLGLWKDLVSVTFGSVSLGKFVAIDHSSTTRVDAYVNGVSAYNNTPVSGSQSGNYFIGALNAAGSPIIYFTMTAKTWVVGNTLTSTEHANLNNAITFFNTRRSRS